MTLVSNDPSWWPFINATLICSYFVVSGSVGIMYDWGLTLGKEIELIWRQRWSLMTFLYLSVRYAGIGHAVINILISAPTISATDAGCLIMYKTWDWIGVVVEVLLGSELYTSVIST
jgi:hypothetical protein